MNKIDHTFLINLEQQSRIFDLIQNGITITNEHSSIIYTNPAFTRITGYSQQEVEGENPGILHSGHHKKKFYKTMWENIIEHGFWEGEIWNRKKTGEIYPEFLTISKVNMINSEKFIYVAVFSDISFLEKDAKKKFHLAYYDPLTKLPNRTYFLERLNHLVANTENEEISSIFFMDLDKFKQVNDTYGHCVGDELLRIVGERLSLLARKNDTIARIGGDEFTAILRVINNESNAINFAKRIIDKIEEPFEIDGHQINISISIGISFYPKDSKGVDKLLYIADKNMYKAKKERLKVFYK